MKKKLLIIVIAIFLFFVLAGIGCVVYYNNGLKPVDANNKEEVLFEVKKGVYGSGLIDALYEKELIKNKTVARIYLKFNGNYAPLAGIYSLNKSMTLKEILEYISKSGNAIEDSVSVTFIEGRRLTDYVSLISKTFGYSEDDIMAVLTDNEFLTELINKYWFLTEDILNDKLYYALEGYLYPDTYAFRTDASIKDIVTKLLDEMGKRLDGLKNEIEASSYSAHEILTMASIVELEGGNSDDRYGVAGVFYNRLNSGMSLGSDVTTYYGARVKMSERDLWQKEIEEVNGYNTRPAAMAGKLPIGPICSPSLNSIKASLEPTKHDYYYFVADKNKKTYFSKTYQEHVNTINKLKNEGLWYEYK
ncbi:MAG: endolytic transglycosylase MltG [Bacilli bacterium]|nr:endolytic transglycosylase MltG [Bacilli bacterium]